MKFSLHFKIAALAGLGLLGCAVVKPAKPAHKSPPAVTHKQPVTKVAEAIPSPTPSVAPSPAPKLEGFSGKTAVFYALNPGGNLERVRDVLKAHPKLHLTIIFPPHYFDLESRRGFMNDFRVMQSSGRIEIALTLENEPNLVMLGDLSSIAKSWNVKFSWPEDIAGQVARATGLYQRRWQHAPNGFVPPYLLLSDQVMAYTQGFRLSWVMGRPNNVWGVRFYGSTAVLIPPKKPAPADPLGAETEASLKDLADWTLERPFAFIDGAEFANGDTEINFLKTLAKQAEAKPAPFELKLGEQTTEYLTENLIFSAKQTLFSDNNFSDWTKSPQQKVAWKALADARQTVETYKNSGHAKLQALDAALDEMYSSEGGPFLLSLGQNVAPLPLNERNFLATLGNVYRHCGEPLPSDFNRMFQNQKNLHLSVKTPEMTEPFFVSGENQLTWNDPAGDDFGGGTYRYPSGNYPAGAFDLRQFAVFWDESYVTFQIALAGTPSEKNIILPLADIYIDVNRLEGAGSVDTLRQRGPVVIDKAAAWEYAVTLSPAGAMLYQSLLGKESRKIGTFNAFVNADAKTISVKIPLDTMRGRPEDWRFTVGLSGTENRRMIEEPVPCSVLAIPGDRNFSGAKAGRATPRYIDVLSPSADDQKQRYQEYEEGRVVTLPYAEPE